MVTSSDDVEILLIDNNLEQRNDLALRLRRLGYLIDIAKNGFHAIKEVEENNFKLLVISDHMGDMSINEIVTIIRSMNNKSEIPMVLYSPPIDDDLELDTLITDLSVNHIILSREFKKLVSKISKYVKK